MKLQQSSAPKYFNTCRALDCGLLHFLGFEPVIGTDSVECLVFRCSFQAHIGPAVPAGNRDAQVPVLKPHIRVAYCTYTSTSNSVIGWHAVQRTDWIFSTAFGHITNGFDA